MRILVICRNPDFADLVESELHHLLADGGFSGARLCIGQEQQQPNGLDSRASYQLATLCIDWVEQQIGDDIESGSLPRLMVISDLSIVARSLADLNPIGEAPYCCEHAALGLLIAAFPEAHFLFPGTDVHSWHHLPMDDRDALRGAISGATILLRDGHTPLFDGTGLRSKLREHTVAKMPGAGVARAWLSTRSDAVVAIDEEEAFAHFCSYIAYRFGCRAFGLTTRAMASRVLDAHLRPIPNIVGAFEDVSLKFPDDDLPDDLAEIDDSSCIRELARVRYRVMVTRALGPDNRTYLDTTWLHLGVDREWTLLLKPLSGIFALASVERYSAKGTTVGALRFTKDPFSPVSWLGATGRGHGAPGRLQVVAERLLRRAERLLPNARSVPVAVYGAVLALEALELTGADNPTTAIEALGLLQEFEATAESLFPGVNSTTTMSHRFDDLQRTVKAIAKGVDNANRDIFELTACLQIVGRLVATYRSLCQFDEEMSCLAAVRELHRKRRRIMLPEKSPFRRWRYDLYRRAESCVVKYINGRLDQSIGSFARVLSGWILVLAAIYALVGDWGSASPLQRMGNGILAAATSFVGTDVPWGLLEFMGVRPKPWWVVAGRWSVVVAGIALSVFHLGLFISHLYVRFSRK